MADSSFREYIKSFGSFRGLLASAGVLIPGASYFTTYAPPYLPSAPILTSSIALAIIIAVYNYEPKRFTFGNRLHPKKATALVGLSASLVLFTIYLFLLKFCTVVPPLESTRSDRFQVGFGKATWSLTAEGKQAKVQSPQETIQDWMLDRALFVPHGPERLWKPWSIHLVGNLNILAFLTCFVLWSFGWALLARYHADVLKAERRGTQDRQTTRRRREQREVVQRSLP